MRLPAATTPMSCMVTPPSARAPRAASAARSTVSLSGCLPNLVMVIPRIQMSSALAMISSPPRARSRSRWPRCRRRRCRPSWVASRTFMPSWTWSGSGSVLMTLPRTLVPSQSTTPATKGTGTPGAANDTMVKLRSSPSVATVDLLELGAGARRAGVAPVEEPRPAGRALVRLQVRASPKHQVVDQRDLCHRTPS